MSFWRQRAREVIVKVMKDNPDVKGDELKKLLRSHYPFGPRENHPYKIWLKEVRLAAGGKTRTKPPESIGGVPFWKVPLE